VEVEVKVEMEMEMEAEGVREKQLDFYKLVYHCLKSL
jgi:hypothetical protein